VYDANPSRDGSQFLRKIRVRHSLHLRAFCFLL